MHDTHNQPAGIYRRISDDREGRELGIQRQEEDNRKLAERLGVKVVDIYSDSDTSASTASTQPRPEYQRLIEDVRAGRIKVILAYTTSRLTRRPREHEDLIDLATQHGVRFFFVASPCFDLNTAAGREVARHMAARDTAEAEDIQERSQRKKLEDAKQGKWNGGTRTYGYGRLVGVNPATGKEVIDHTDFRNEEEVAVLQEANRRTMAGESQSAIVLDFNARGLRRVKGGKWTVGKFRKTLLNQSYVIFDDGDVERRGTRVHKNRTYRATWPGLFTQAEHDALAAVFVPRASQTNWVYPAMHGRSYLLSGLLRCGKCSGPMYGQGRTMNGKYERRYHCKKTNNRGEVIGCGGIFRIAEPIDMLISEAVLYRFDSPEVARALSPQEDQARVNELVQEIAQLSQRREDLATEHAVDPYEDYRTMVETIKAKTQAAADDLARLRSKTAKSLLLPTDGGLRTAWEGASISWKVSIIKLLVGKIVVHPWQIRRQGMGGLAV
jgi:DNA invertase Pin-like site-specific DNA recombinase